MTDGVRVIAKPFYIAEKSNPEENQYVFGYRITISNEGTEPVQLISRHWIIIDGDGEREDVRGPGVVGQTPVIEPGKRFTYTSGCPLNTEWGSMEGNYQMKRPNGEIFDAKIGRFFLTMQARELSGAAD